LKVIIHLHQRSDCLDPSAAFLSITTMDFKQKLASSPDLLADLLSQAAANYFS
jgi:hypothetical protein